MSNNNNESDSSTCVHPGILVAVPAVLVLVTAGITVLFTYLILKKAMGTSSDKSKGDAENSPSKEGDEENADAEEREPLLSQYGGASSSLGKKGLVVKGTQTGTSAMDDDEDSTYVEPLPLTLQQRLKLYSLCYRQQLVRVFEARDALKRREQRKGKANKRDEIALMSISTSHTGGGSAEGDDRYALRHVDDAPVRIILPPEVKPKVSSNGKPAPRSIDAQKEQEQLRNNIFSLLDSVHASRCVVDGDGAPISFPSLESQLGVSHDDGEGEDTSTQKPQERLLSNFLLEETKEEIRSLIDPKKTGYVPYTTLAVAAPYIAQLAACDAFAVQPNESNKGKRGGGISAFPICGGTSTYDRQMAVENICRIGRDFNVDDTQQSVKEGSSSEDGGEFSDPVIEENTTTKTDQQQHELFDKAAHPELTKEMFVKKCAGVWRKLLTRAVTADQRAIAATMKSDGSSSPAPARRPAMLRMLQFADRLTTLKRLHDEDAEKQKAKIHDNENDTMEAKLSRVKEPVKREGLTRRNRIASIVPPSEFERLSIAPVLVSAFEALGVESATTATLKLLRLDRLYETPPKRIMAEGVIAEALNEDQSIRRAKTVTCGAVCRAFERYQKRRTEEHRRLGAKTGRRRAVVNDPRAVTEKEDEEEDETARLLKGIDLKGLSEEEKETVLGVIASMRSNKKRIVRDQAQRDQQRREAAEMEPEESVGPSAGNTKAGRSTTGVVVIDNHEFSGTFSLAEDPEEEDDDEFEHDAGFSITSESFNFSPVAGSLPSNPLLPGGAAAPNYHPRANPRKRSQLVVASAASNGHLLQRIIDEARPLADPTDGLLSVNDGAKVMQALVPDLLSAVTTDATIDDESMERRKNFFASLDGAAFHNLAQVHAQSPREGQGEPKLSIDEIALALAQLEARALEQPSEPALAQFQNADASPLGQPLSELSLNRARTGSEVVTTNPSLSMFGCTAQAEAAAAQEHRDSTLENLGTRLLRNAQHDNDRLDRNVPDIAISSSMSGQGNCNPSIRLTAVEKDALLDLFGELSARRSASVMRKSSGTGEDETREGMAAIDPDDLPVVMSKLGFAVMGESGGDDVLSPVPEEVRQRRRTIRDTLLRSLDPQGDHEIDAETFTSALQPLSSIAARNLTSDELDEEELRHINSRVQEIGETGATWRKMRNTLVVRPERIQAARDALERSGNKANPQSPNSDHGEEAGATSVSLSASPLALRARLTAFERRDQFDQLVDARREFLVHYRQIEALEESESEARCLLEQEEEELTARMLKSHERHMHLIEACQGDVQGVLSKQAWEAVQLKFKIRELEDTIRCASARFERIGYIVEGMSPHAFAQIKAIVKKPPIGVELVMEAVLTILGEKPVSWERARQVMGYPMLRRIKRLQATDIQRSTIAAVRRQFLRRPEFDLGRIGEASQASLVLGRWVTALVQYDERLERDGDREQIAVLEAKLKKAQSSLVLKKAQLPTSAERDLLGRL